MVIASINYLISTTAPFSSSCFFDALGLCFGDSFFNGFRSGFDKVFCFFQPETVTARTTLITWIFFAPPSLRMTENSVCSSTASAAAPPAAGAAGNSNRRGRFHAELVFDALDKIAQIQHRFAANCLDNFS